VLIGLRDLRSAIVCSIVTDAAARPEGAAAVRYPGEEMIMRLVVAMLASVGVGAVSLALADPPTTAPAQDAAATQAAAATPGNPAATPQAAAPAAAATSAANVTITGSPAATPAVSQVDPLEKHFLSEGYKIEMHHGEKYFCRKEEELGSRLGGQKYCSTVEQLKATEQEAKASVDKSMMQQNNPAGH
jgi:pyruvate/2-oxoglutarate dehydrogenase complex dihydrolipoamide acyltransferase (E2) component